MPDTIVVKIGGSTLGAHDTTLADVVALRRRGLRPVVVHDGVRHGASLLLATDEHRLSQIDEAP